MVKFLFSVYIITEAKRSNRQGGARAVDLPAGLFDLARPGVAPPLIMTFTSSQPQTYIYSMLDAVPPIHAESSHVATDKDPSK